MCFLTRFVSDMAPLIRWDLEAREAGTRRPLPARAPMDSDPAGSGDPQAVRLGALVGERDFHTTSASSTSSLER